MALGDLSPDQARYVDAVAAATGLSRQVVVAWVGSESGWGTTKANHNYLNVGPGETYTSVEQAAARAASLVRTSNNYAGIRAAVPVGGTAQVQAIGASPWGTSSNTLTAVYADLNGVPRTTDGAGGVAVKPVSLTSAIGDIAGAGLKAAGGIVGAFTNPLGAGAGISSGALGGVTTPAADAAKAAVSGLGDLTGTLGSALGIDVGAVLGGVGRTFVSAGLALVFAVAALGLIALGLNRLTGVPAGQRFAQLQKAAGTAATVAAVA